MNVNPISILADASRGLMAGNADASDILISLGVAAALTAVFLPLTTQAVQQSLAGVEHRSKSTSPSMSRSRTVISRLAASMATSPKNW